ncbi:hypothetical protein LMG28727_07594 [Paraburkholderia kirstenboschensis]|nr:hypothetical protein LMG28727_07594 [Paraburkholderia kirstenboschensis]
MHGARSVIIQGKRFDWVDGLPVNIVELIVP